MLQVSVTRYWRVFVTELVPCLPCFDISDVFKFFMKSEKEPNIGQPHLFDPLA